MIKKVVSRGKKRQKRKLSPEEKLKRKEQREHIKPIRYALGAMGFSRIGYLSDKEFVYKGSKCDFDDIFIHENIVVMCEYTTIKENDVSQHLRNKKVVFDKIKNSDEEFVEFLKQQYESFSEKCSDKYQNDQYVVRIMYCSLNGVKSSVKADFENIVFYDLSVSKYFFVLANTIKLSSRFEFFDFLGIDSTEVSENALKPNSAQNSCYQGSLLPEGHSNFSKGFKVVSFYVDPAALLCRSYVLRRDGWREGDNLFQRMIVKSKIDSMRGYLIDKERVYVNNIIVTLPNNTKIIDESGDTINLSKIKKTCPANIQIPNEFSSVGIVDGQHRVFSYYEGGSEEEKISILRERQNLLATGIIFPSGYSDSQKRRFEANLFLEINDNQTRTRSDLRQEITLIIKPFSNVSISRRVMRGINDGNGPLGGEFEKYFYDKNKIKTTSVVSYGISPIVKTSGDDSFYHIWDHSGKTDMIKNQNEEVLMEYIEFCVSQINLFFSSVRSVLRKDLWTPDKNVEGRYPTTTFVNGIIGCLRRVIRHGMITDFEGYRDKFSGLDEFDFYKYKSSQYNQMGEDLYNEFIDK